MHNTDRPTTTTTTSRRTSKTDGVGKSDTIGSRPNHYRKTEREREREREREKEREEGMDFRMELNSTCSRSDRIIRWSLIDTEWKRVKIKGSSFSSRVFPPPNRGRKSWPPTVRVRGRRVREKCIYWRRVICGGYCDKVRISTIDVASGIFLFLFFLLLYDFFKRESLGK